MPQGFIMSFKRGTFPVCAALLLTAAVACDQSADRIAGGRSFAPRPAQRDIAATNLYVTNVEQLYAEVNNPENTGAVVTLAPGTYVLSATNAGGGARQNGGRLEMQLDMSLVDARSLPASSFSKNISFGRTGVVRIGRGSNTVEWLTILGNPDAAAGIAAELTGTPSTRIRVVHVVSGGSSRGLDIRNVSATMIGRRIDAEITDNELIGPTQVVGMSEGIRLSNFVGADAGIVVATLSGNRVHGFQLGCILANNRSSNASIDVRSSGDQFFGNALGCLITGGLSQATTGVANSNSTIFEAHGSQFVDNTVPIPGIDPGGVRVAGGLSTVQPNVTSNNTVSVALWGSKVSDNQVMNFEAFGAWQGSLAGVAGTNNRVTIELHGVSKQIDVLATASLPVDPTGSNTLAVIR